MACRCSSWATRRRGRRVNPPPRARGSGRHHRVQPANSASGGGSPGTCDGGKAVVASTVAAELVAEAVQQEIRREEAAAAALGAVTAVEAQRHPGPQRRRAWSLAPRPRAPSSHQGGSARAVCAARGANWWIELTGRASDAPATHPPVRPLSKPSSTGSAVELQEVNVMDLAAYQQQRFMELMGAVGVASA
jgi:hypothetical protein